MKNYLRAVVLCGLGFALVGHTYAQGTFQNLDFEQAHNIPVFDPHGHPWIMSAADALPGWVCYIGTTQVGSASYNDVALDSAALGIQSSTAPYVPAGLLNGQYCASLQYGVILISNGIAFRASASIAQSGQIPASSKSVIFRGSTSPSIVSFAGHTIPLVVLSPETGYNLYAGDITAFAGQAGELRFTSGSHFDYLDDILFSPESIPEPSSLALLVTGAFLFGSLLAFRRARPKP